MKKFFYILISCFIFTNEINAQGNYHDTQGQIDVGPSGQVNYSMPIALPPALANVGPELTLTYSSGQNHGIAGQGWSLTGLSAIQRISTRIDIDGFINAVDFDDNDKLSLDGMRLLLKSGAYLQDGAEYMTEIQSNVKIIQSGSGDHAFFIVYEPDGSRKWYGQYANQTGRDHTSFYIMRYEDVDGNFITFQYFRPYNHSLCIQRVLFSANVHTNALPLNEIEFQYEQNTRREYYFVKGQKFTKSELLKRVIVKTNSLQFRKYEITHTSEGSSGYQRVSQVQEFNGQNEPANPVVFEYDETTMLINGSEHNRTFTNNMSDSPQLSGDFDGDGNLDVFRGNKIILNLIDTNPVTINTTVSYTYNSFASHTFKHEYEYFITTRPKINQKLIQKDIITRIKVLVDRFIITNFELNNGQLIVANEKTILFNNHFEYILDEYIYNICDDEIYLSSTDYCYSNGFNTKNRFFYIGDFNSDGITDIFFLDYKDELIKDRRDYYSNSCGQSYYDCYNEDFIYSDIKGHFFSLDDNMNLYEFNIPNHSDLNASYWMPGVSLSGSKKPFETSSFDFNGDGKVDIISKYYKFFNINFENNLPIGIEFIGEFKDMNGLNYLKTLFGDFNGDGKTDYMFPNADGHWNNRHDHQWHIYFANPKPNQTTNFFDKETHLITEYYKDTGNVFTLRKMFMQYFAIDINKDGKTDLVSYWTQVYKDVPSLNDWDTEWQVRGFVNNIGKHGQTTGYTFNQEYSPPLIQNPVTGIWMEDKHNSPSEHIPSLITMPHRSGNLMSDLALVRKDDNTIVYINFTKDFTKDNRLKKVRTSTNAITYEIDYEELNTIKAPAFYSSSNSLNYPFVEINNVFKSYAVKQLRSINNNIIRRQDFKYKGLAINYHGLGNLGFIETARSGWYQITDTDPKVWQVNIHNPLNRNALNHTYTRHLLNADFQFIPWNNLNPSTHQLISRSSRLYDYQVNPSTKLVTFNHLQTITDDFINQTKQQTDNIYQGIYNLKTSEIVQTSFIGATNFLSKKTNVFTFDNNPTGTNNNYYIGRLTKVESKTEQYNDTKEHEDHFDFQNNRLISTRKRPKISANNLPFITETFSYFPNGLVQSKTLTAPGASPAVTARTVSYTYDSTNRFVATTTDHLNFTQINNSFHPLYGMVTQTTNHIGQSTYYQFDNWGKQTRITDYLGKKIESFYTKTNNEFTTLNISDDGTQTQTIKDIFGKTLIEGHTDFKGRWLFKRTEYDSKDRLRRTSEPYFAMGGSATQWTTQTYDNFSRVITKALHTGLTATNTYTYINQVGTRVQTNDGNKTTSVILDAINNKINSTDPGGSINYTYDANNNLIQTNYDGILLTMGYDHWGRKTSLNDPSAGLFTYSYNIYGDNLTEQTPKGTFTYNYDALGILTDKVILENGISKTYNYSYHPTTKKLIGVSHNGATPFQSTYTYDPQQNLTGYSETHNNHVFAKSFEYDGFGRLQTTHFNATSSTGLNSSTTIHNDYQFGEVYRLRDQQTGTTLIETIETNAREQVTQSKFGNNIFINNAYNTNGYLTSSNHRFNNTTDRMLLSYNFHQQRGNLLSRTYNLYGGFSTAESFQYDTLDRLTHYPASNGTTMVQSYDNRGRITTNELGAFHYLNNSKPYQNTGLTPNGSTNHAYYNNRPQLNIDYNIHKAPNTIHEQGHDRFTFEYDGDGNRLATYSGNENVNHTIRPIKKYFSSDGTFEIHVNTLTNEQNIYTYVEGNPYAANFVKKTTTSGSEYLYLHKDYLGSILAVSNQAGTVIEKRHFEAWGQLTKYWKTGGSTALPNGKTTFLLLDRGYTGHEHLLSIGIIHMNGRLYDPKLHRFLMPDNYVQDPSNTQNYNRYGYVLNNPLKYNDPSGEEFISLGLAIGISAFISAASYTLGVLYGPGTFDVGDLFKSLIVSTASTVVTFGIGEIASTITNIYQKIAFQVVAHGVTQGGFAALNGGNFWQGFLSGSLSSLASSLWAGDMNTSKTWGGARSLIGKTGEFGKSGFMTVAFGTAAGAGGAALAGGNWWQGAATGFAVSMFNHFAHDGGKGNGNSASAASKDPKKFFKEVLARLRNIMPTDSPNLVNAAIAGFTGQFRHIFGPDAIYTGATTTFGPIIVVNLQRGYITLLRGPNAFKSYAVHTGGVGLSTPSADISGEFLKLFYSGSTNNISIDAFTGKAYEYSLSAKALGALSFSFLHGPSTFNSFVLGYGFSLGVGASLTILNAQFVRTETNQIKK